MMHNKQYGTKKSEKCLVFEAVEPHFTAIRAASLSAFVSTSSAPAESALLTILLWKIAPVQSD